MLILRICSKSSQNTVHAFPIRILNVTMLSKLKPLNHNPAKDTSHKR